MNAFILINEPSDLFFWLFGAIYLIFLFYNCFFMLFLRLGVYIVPYNKTITRLFYEFRAFEDGL